MASIRRKMASGIFFTAIAKYVGVVMSLVVTAILARLLSPEQFGIIAIATVIIAFLNMVADLGLTSTIIQYKNFRREKLGNLFSWSLYISVALSVTLLLIAPSLSSFYQQPALTEVCRWLALSLFFSGASIVPSALFYREQLFRNLAWRSVIAQAIGGIASIGVAFAQGGIYALLIGPVLSSVLIFVISYSKFPLPFYAIPSTKLLKSIYRYSGYQFLFNMINFFSRNADTLLIGRILGMERLGQYDKAYRLMSLPLQNITQVISPVMHPILIEVAHDKNFLRKFNEQLSFVLASIGFPLSVYLFFCGHELIMLFFGDQWESAIPPFQALSLSVGTQIVLSSSGAIFQTVGNTRLLFFSGLASAVLNVGAVCVGVLLGKSINTVALGLSLTFSINFVCTYLLMYRVVFRSTAAKFFKNLTKPVLWSAALAALFTTYGHLFESDENYLWSLAAKTLIFLLFLLVVIRQLRLIKAFHMLDGGADRR